MGKYKVFVSFVTPENKRVWKTRRVSSIRAACEVVNLISEKNLVSYVRIERV